MQKVFNVAVDIGRKLPAPAFEVNTNDLKSVKLLISITNGQTLLDLTDTTVRIAIRKPDNNIIFQDCTVNDATNGQVEIILENQAYITPGTHTAEIMCYKGSEVVAVSGTFSYKSTKGIMNDEAVESRSEFTAINQKIEEAKKLLEDVAESGVGVDEQARQEIQEVTAQLADTSQQVEFPVTNLLGNSNFANGSTSWEAIRGTFTQSNGELTITGNGAGDTSVIRQYATFVPGHIYYIKTDVTADDSVSKIGLELYPNETAPGTIATIDNPEVGKTYTLTGITSPNPNLGTRIELLIRNKYTDATAANGKRVKIKRPILIDLTETFGAGNEPSKQRFDKIISNFPDKWFNTKASLKNNKDIHVLSDKKMPATIIVAAHNSSYEDKSIADYVCDGVNDEEELNLAMEQFKVHSGKVRLCNGDYWIDSLFDSGHANTGKFGIVMKYPSNQREIIIEGSNAPIRKFGSMTAGVSPVIHLRKALYDSLSNTELVTMLGAMPLNVTTGSIDYPCLSMDIRNIGIAIPDNKKRIRLIDGMYLSTMKVANYIGTLDIAGAANFTIGNPDCIGLRGLQGWNFGAGYRIDNCFIFGMGIPYDLNGEHLIMQDCGCRFSLYSYRFGAYGTESREAWRNAHPNTLINCCHEQCLNGPYFKGNSPAGQTYNFIDYNKEHEAKNGWLETTFAKEEFPGAFVGTVTYSVVDDTYINMDNVPFWEQGSGIRFKTTNTHHRHAGTTAQRPSAPNLYQDYFDTTINKPIKYINGKWVDYTGATV